MNENLKWFAAAVAVVGLSVDAVIYVSQSKRATPPAEPVAAEPTQPAVPEEPAVAQEPAVKHPTSMIA